MNPEPSSAENTAGPAPVGARGVVTLVLIGRTLRGTLGEEFRAEAVALHERMHGPSAAPPHTALARTVELTAVAVTTLAPLHLSARIAEPAFTPAHSHPTPAAELRQSAPSSPLKGRFGATRRGSVEGAQVFVVEVEHVEGIRALHGPPGVDLRRTVVVEVEAATRPELDVQLVVRD
ncbi:hypothetical protein ACEXQB_015920 [Herbiconiux sp. P18]|uniref:hypothetical protein n=1 Tax=Herbiconiux liangxiaofengii TaxID=3342795 RepID=UPI0035B95475